MARPGSRLCASILSAGLAAGLAAAPPVPAFAVETPRSFAADYLVTWLNVPVYQTRFRALIRPNSYRAVMSARSLGVVEMATRIRVHFESVGRIVSDSFRPQAVRQIYLLKTGQFRHVDMTYGTDGRVATAIRPPEGPGKRRPVPDALVRYTQDPISALLGAVSTALTAKPCHHTASVFEGRRRVDTRLTHAGVERTPPLPVANLPARAEVCLLHARRIAGFQPRHYRRMPKMPPARLWVVRHPGARIWLPVQLRMDTRWGPIVARLTRFAAATR
ncbi:MAG: DUF3108 domain-containing protein [Bauldia litoralis]